MPSLALAIATGLYAPLYCVSDIKSIRGGAPGNLKLPFAAFVKLSSLNQFPACPDWPTKRRPDPSMKTSVRSLLMPATSVP